MKKNITIIMLILLLIPVKSHTQTNDVFEEIQYKNGYISFAKIKKGKSIKVKTEDESIIKELTGNKSDISSVMTTLDVPTKRNLKIQQQKYQLYKKGIKLRGGEYINSVVNDTVDFVHGFFATVSDEMFTNDVSICTDKALEYFNATHVIKDTTNESAGVAEKVTQIYYYDNAKEKFRAAWQVKVTSKNTAWSENIFISAATGEFMGAENLICDINFTGTAQTRYSGTRNVVTDASTSAGPFRLQETRNGVQIRTRSMNNRTDLSLITEIKDNNDNNWTGAELGTDRAALDAHWGAEMVLDYWLTVHNRNSINGSSSNPLSIESYIHLGTNVFNARWFQNSVQYGDGVVGNNPLTSLDICAHELGHGVDQYTGNLLYERESGALDEGFADIWGASIEAWADPTKSRWLIGEDVLGGPIRNMANPNAFGQPDTYLGTNWVTQVGCTPSFDPNNGNDGCGVHTNSGVLNFWYFLLSQGGSGTNDLGNTYNVTGLGISTAEKIAYATKLLMNSSSVDYPLCRSLSIQAATNLYGVNSCQVINTTNAWYAVGVGAPFQYANVTTSGVSLVCSSGNTYSLANLPSGCTVSWSVGPYLAIVSGQNTNYCVIRSTGVGNSTITATVVSNCANVALPPLNVISGQLPTPIITGPTTAKCGYDLNYQVDEVNRGYGKTYSWDSDIIFVVADGDKYRCTATASENGSGTIYCTVTACGVSKTGYKSVIAKICPTYNMNLSPNPATNIVEVTMEKIENDSPDSFSKVDESASGAVQEYTVRILNTYGTPVYSTRQTGNTFTLSTANLKNGTYIVEVSDGENVYTKQLIVKH